MESKNNRFTELTEREDASDISKYVEYATANAEDIGKIVNMQFEEAKGVIKAKLIEQIQVYLTPIPTHYKWEYDGCPYDYSGRLVENGTIDLDQTVSDFLESEYSGNTEATYVSRMGLRYNTYGDELSYETLNIACNIMLSSIHKQLEKHFEEKISTELFSEIREECDDFDDIYDNCLAFEFFSYEPAIEFAGIGNIKLSQIINK